MTYKVVRFYYNCSIKNQVIKERLTLEEAQSHCKNPETSSRTCRKPVNVKRTGKFGPWFDGFEKE